ncbi:TMhelix containing protein [Vibrio phage 1.265.O._10N.286.52.F6]|nr:TMhelix containing protein [Vibrio phage 1.265.O._10N.286.52.F6]
MEILIVLSAALIYFLPTLVAGFRAHNNGVPIFIVNLVAGWSVIGWFGCLAWSFSNNK